GGVAQPGAVGGAQRRGRVQAAARLRLVERRRGRAERAARPANGWESVGWDEALRSPTTSHRDGKAGGTSKTRPTLRSQSPPPRRPVVGVLVVVRRLRDLLEQLVALDGQDGEEDRGPQPGPREPPRQPAEQGSVAV